MNKHTPHDNNRLSDDALFGQFREDPAPGFSERLYAVLEKADSGVLNSTSVYPDEQPKPRTLPRRGKRLSARAPLTLVASMVAVIAFTVIALDLLRPSAGDRAQQIDLDALPVITVDNASGIDQIASIGRGAAFHAAWSPDGGQIAVSSASGVYLHDLTGDERHLISAGEITQAAYSPDGTRLAVIRNGVIEVYAIANGELLTQIEGPAAAQEVVFAPPGFSQANALFVKYCGFGGDDRACIIQLLDTTTGQPLSSSVNVSNSAQMVPIRGLFIDETDGNVGLFDLRTGESLAVLPTRELVIVPALAKVSADGTTLAMVSESSTTPRVFVYRLDRILDGDFTPINDFFFTQVNNSSSLFTVNTTISADGGLFAMSTLGGGLYVADARTSETVLALPNNTDLRIIERIKFSPDGTRITLLGSNSAIKVRTLPPNEQIINITGYSTADDVVFSPDGSVLIVNNPEVGGTQTVTLNSETLEFVVFEGPAGGSVGVMAYNPAMDRVAYVRLGIEDRFVSNQPFNQLRLRDLTTEEETVLLDYAGVNVFYAPDGGVYNLDRNARLSRWEPESSTETTRMRNIDVYYQQDLIGEPVYTPDGRMMGMALCTAYESIDDIGDVCVDSYIQLRDTNNTARLTTLPLDGFASAFEITGDGSTMVASVCAERIYDGIGLRCLSAQLLVFDITPVYDRIGEVTSRSEGDPITAQHVIPLQETLNQTHAIAIHPTTNLIAIAGDGLQIAAVDLAGGTLDLLGSWSVQTNHAAFDPSGRLLATADMGIVHLWAVP